MIVARMLRPCSDLFVLTAVGDEEVGKADSDSWITAGFKLQHGNCCFEPSVVSMPS